LSDHLSVLPATRTPRQKRLVLNTVLMASFSALYVVFRSTPTYPLLGIPGATFKAGDIIAPLYGILLGPLLGPLSIAIGTTMAFFTGAPPIFLGLDFLPASMSATVVGLVSRKRKRESILLNLTAIFIFLLLPFTVFFVRIGPYSIPFIWFHIVALGLLISPLSTRAADLNSLGPTSSLFDHPSSVLSKFWGFLVLALIGTLAQHIVGGILTQVVVGINYHSVPGRYSSWQAFWTFIFYVYPFERVATAIAAAAVAVPSIIAIRRSRLAQFLQEPSQKE
jgi:hypothetical protein